MNFVIGFTGWCQLIEGWDPVTMKTEATDEKQAIKQAQFLAGNFAKDFHVLYDVYTCNTWKPSVKHGKVADPKPVKTIIERYLTKKEAMVVAEKWNKENAHQYPLGKRAYFEYSN